MTTFLLGLLAGAVATGLVLLPRLRGARDAERGAAEAQRAAQAELTAARTHADQLASAREAAHEQQLAALRAATAEKLDLLAGTRTQLAEQVKAASADALRQVSEQFERLAAAQREADRAAASGELGKRTEEIKRSLDPIAESLKRVGEEVTRLDRERQSTHGQMRQMFETMHAEVGRLRDQTGTLVTALKRPQVRGAWGEMQLRNCVTAANMTEHVDFVAQASVDGGRLRPDLVVHLPAERDVVVDAKVPMEAYLRALETADETEQRDLLQRHGRQTRQHIDSLASKAYHAQFETSPEFVVMFIPNEGVYCAALEAEPTLLEYGAAKGVLIATPTTLIALLHATYYGWRQERIAQSAREIAAAGRELHKRLASFLEPYAKLGRQLNSAVNAYNQSVGSLDARVLPQLRRLEAAGAGSEKPLPALRGLDGTARLVIAAEEAA
jgi:DNA recombination protein RmuC